MQTVFREGDVPKHYFFIIEGEVFALVA